MKFCWKPSFIKKRGKFEPVQTLPKLTKNGEPEPAESRAFFHRQIEIVRRRRSENEGLTISENGRRECEKEGDVLGSLADESIPLEINEEDGKTISGDFDDNSCFSYEPEKKKKGVSGESSESRSPIRASDIKLPEYEKNVESSHFIKEAIRGNEFLKDGLFACEDVAEAVVRAMYLKRVANNVCVIREGEIGSHMYVVAKGYTEVYKGTVKVNTLGPGKIFGELALLYNSRRNATILAKTNCEFWVLDRKVFQHIMKKSGMQMTEKKVQFLKSVPLLSSLQDDILVKMTDLLKLRSYPAGSVIIRQGDEGSLFYILTGGTVAVEITQSDGTVLQGPILKAGDFFGEKALLRDEKRAATVTAREPGVECLTLDRVHFIEYLGGLQEVRDVAFDRIVRTKETVASECAHVNLDDLNFVGTLGVGAFGRVELVQHKRRSDAIFALKRVKKIDVLDLGQQEHVYNEKENMMMCRSPFIVRMYKTFKSSKYLYFLMEFCQGGDVWSLLRKKRFFDEPLARFTTACTVEAFEYLHDRGIAFRDLKPENVMFDSGGYAKLADFGFSKKLGPAEKTWTFAGTPEYVAPEIILNEGHNRAVDYWTLGIFVHELLVGKPPFRGRNHSQTYTLILKGIDSVAFPPLLGRTAQLLIRKLCRRTPAERLGCQRRGVADIKKHKWFQNFEWESLRETTLPSPHRPKLTGPLDLSCFDKCPEDGETPPDEFGDWDVHF